jgi:hypothetical protein
LPKTSACSASACGADNRRLRKQFACRLRKHGSLLKGDMGAALLAMRLAPTSNLADLVHRRAEANMGLPIRELMWGMPGSMLAAIHMAEMTEERDGAAVRNAGGPADGRS